LGFAFPPAPNAWHLISGWHPEWLMFAGGCIALVTYIAGVRRLRTLDVPWSVGRLLCFSTGIVLLIWSTSGGVSKYAMVTFSAHMIQHMTLSMIAPIFIVLGMPVTLALRALPSASDDEHRNTRAWILAGIHSPYSRLISHPLLVLAIFTFGLYGLYFTSFFSTLMGSHSGHVLMEIHFLLVGLLFSWVIIGLDPMPREFPHWARLILVLVAISLHAFFAIAIMQSSIPIGDAWYSQVTPPWITDPLVDSNLAGGIAWGFGEVPTLILMVLVAVQWSRKDARLAKQIDRAADRDDDAQLKAYNEQLARMNSNNIGD
jgi:putative copper resistance protein D